jgi:ERCC4-type nuclease
MKTIEQLLQLSKNPYYVFQPDEQRLLDDFLSKKQASTSKKSRKKSSKESSEKTNVRVRNIVEKVIPSVPESTKNATEDTESVS